MRIYVASSWRNKHQPNVVDALITNHFQVYDFRRPDPTNLTDDGFHWSEIDPEWQQWEPRRFWEALDHPIAQEGYRKDFTALATCDACVLVLPSGRSAHLEAGWAAGSGKVTAVYMPEPGEPELMYKLLGPIFDDLSALVAHLRRAECDLEVGWWTAPAAGARP